jgi:hypothetical protein
MVDLQYFGACSQIFPLVALRQIIDLNQVEIRDISQIQVRPRRFAPPPPAGDTISLLCLFRQRGIRFPFCASPASGEYDFSSVPLPPAGDTISLLCLFRQRGIRFPFCASSHSDLPKKFNTSFKIKQIEID